MATLATAPTPESIALHLDEVASGPARRPRVILIGTAFAAAASAMLILGLLAMYSQVRAEVLALGEVWLPEGSVIPLSPGNMGLLTLGMSLVMVQWAVYSGVRRDRQHAYLALGATILFGIAHVTQIGYLWTQWNLPLNGEGSFQAVLLFTILGLHIAMVAAALIYLALMTVRSLGGQFTGHDAEGLSAAALYWYVTVAVYSVIWFVVLILK